jgi:hypothetical protein
MCECTQLTPSQLHNVLGPNSKPNFVTAITMVAAHHCATVCHGRHFCTVTIRLPGLLSGPPHHLRHAPMSTRAQNEKKFGAWDELPGGGRCYRLEVNGRLGWRARYLKEVDAADVTLRFWQEVYDGQGRLIEIHEKFPVDKGHQNV